MLLWAHLDISIAEGKNPPVGTIKNFVHLLNDSDFDFDEEIGKSYPVDLRTSATNNSPNRVRTP